MGTMQRKHRKLREAMRREGEPLPSLMAARRRLWWSRVVACGKAAAAVTRVMASINTVRSVVEKAKRAAAGLPPHQVITITGLPDPLAAEEMDKVLKALEASSGGRIKLVV